jgi:hypothetical protein
VAALVVTAIILAVVAVELVQPELRQTQEAMVVLA